MPRKPAVRQVWQCPTCGETYRSPIAVKAVLCATYHFRKSRAMKLVEDHT